MSDQDPAVGMWQESTSAQLRAVTRERDELVRRLGKAEAECRAAGTSREFNRQRANEAVRELAEARAEIKQLRAQLDSLPGYHLTEKARAALAADPKEPS